MGVKHDISEYKSALPDAMRKLAQLSDSAVNLLLSASTPLALRKGEGAIGEGQMCTRIYFVEQGCLRAFYNRDGVEINTGFFLEHSFATNLKSLRTGAPSEYAIEAMEASVLRAFDKNTLLVLYEQSAEVESFGRKLLESLLVGSEEHAAMFKLYAPAQRYEYIAEHLPHLLQRISLTHLASYIGVTRETLSRIRKRRQAK